MTRPPLWHRLGWFALLYAAGIVAVALVASVIRFGLGM
ncbi:MAG: DUF2474 family protein [Geminicoccaceae bacterium]|nr:DUF2474 family protein [Geminicoccaceae bacterium]